MSKRNSKGKTIKPIIYVFCEGETEELYINWLRTIFRVPIKIQAKVLGTSITDLSMNHFIKEQSGEKWNGKDLIFLVYDGDKKEVINRLEKLKSKNTLLISTPCIELWFLLHFQAQTSSLENDGKVIQLLQKHWKNYKKNHLSLEEKKDLEKNLQDAVLRAKNLTAYSNPSSLFYLFIEKLQEIQLYP